MTDRFLLSNAPAGRFATAHGASMRAMAALCLAAASPATAWAQVDRTQEISNIAVAGETCYVEPATGVTYCAQVSAQQYINAFPFLLQFQIDERYYTPNFEFYGSRTLACPLPDGALSITNRSASLSINQDSAVVLCSNYGSYNSSDGTSGPWQFSGTVVVRVQWVDPIDLIDATSNVRLVSQTPDPGELRRLTCDERRGEGTRGSIAINEKSYPLMDFSTYGSFSKRTCKRVANAQP